MSKDFRRRSPRSPWVQRVLGYTIVLLVVFLLGFVPMWLKSRESARNLAQAEQHLALARMENTLAAATIDARRGAYESARQSAGDFFTMVRTEVDRGEDSALSSAQREGIRPLLAQRDETVTLLARSDPAAADRLSDLYSAYREVMQ
jgi:succinate dehydrogenase hydrophobic anchor subunit